MGKSGHPAKRARQEGRGRMRPPRRDSIEVSTAPDRGLVVLDVGGELTGMTVRTTDMLIQSLTNARNEIASREDQRPHSRACGMTCGPGHGAHCSKDCPTCHGNPLEAAQAL